MTFDPVGSEGEQQIDCQTFTYLFDQAGTTRQPLIDIFWPRESRCANAYDSEVPLDSTFDVSADATSGTTSRTTSFTLPEFPNLAVELRQSVCGSQLVQRYEVTNLGTTDADLRFTRGADVDIPYYVANVGTAHTSGYGATVSRSDLAVSMSITAPEAGSDATFEGWRVLRGFYGGTAVHPEILSSYGYDASLTGSDGDGMNGIWYSPGTNWCEVGTEDTYMGANLTELDANGGDEGDYAGAVQSTLTVPALETRTYVTETLADPGYTCSADEWIAVECCDGSPNPGALLSCANDYLSDAVDAGSIAQNQVGGIISSIASSAQNFCN